MEPNGNKSLPNGKENADSPIKGNDHGEWQLTSQRGQRDQEPTSAREHGHIQNGDHSNQVWEPNDEFGEQIGHHENANKLQAMLLAQIP